MLVEFRTLESWTGWAKVFLWIMWMRPSQSVCILDLPWRLENCLGLLFTLISSFTSLENANGLGTLMDYVGIFILKSFIFIDSFDTTHLGCLKSRFPVDYKLISFMNLCKDAGYFFYPDSWAMRQIHVKNICLTSFKHFYRETSLYFS